MEKLIKSNQMNVSLIKTSMTVLATDIYSKIGTLVQVLLIMIITTKQVAKTSATLQTSGLSIDFDCSHQDEFFYAKPNSQCYSYYKCKENHDYELLNCPSGAFFDFYRQECSRTSGVCYEPVCTGRVDGKYPDTTHACRRSFTCRGGKIVSVDNCQRGHLFDGEKCTNQDLVTCDLPETTAVAYPYAGDLRCRHLTNGNHLILKNNNFDCRKYLQCDNGEVLNELICPSNHRFNVNLRKCTPAQESPVCDFNHAKDDEKLCNQMKDGYHVNPLSNDCRDYMKCANGKLASKHTCSPQAVFNGNSCVPTPLYECTHNAKISAASMNLCKNKNNNELVINPKNDCSSYVRCVNNEVSEYLKCTNNKFFDPHLKTCTLEKKCNKRQQTTECLNMANGFYQDKSLKSNCRQYYYCFNGNRTDFKCPIGLLYDGDSCVPDIQYICPNRDVDSCDLRADGYYRDKTSCRSYYLCSGSKKYSYLCDSDKIFDLIQLRCVFNKNLEKCDYETIECANKPDGYYPDLKSNCHSYYFCKNNEKVQTLTCRGSTKIFNGSGCVNRDLFTCPSNENNNKLVISDQANCIHRKCQQSIKECRHDGFFIDYDSKCINYYFCIGGKKTVLQCASNYVFNGEICVPMEKFLCPRYCTTTIASTKCT